jgi:5'-nucleotidase
LKDYFQKRIDPRNNEYYWLDTEEMTVKEGGDVDVDVVRRGKISITPIRFDLTDHQFIQSLQAWPILGLGEDEESN